jgi:hypothetical protein
MRSSSCALVVIVTLLTVACSTHVAADAMPGTYVAEYSMGEDTLKLNRDLCAARCLQGQPPVDARRSWTFDAERSKNNIQRHSPVGKYLEMRDQPVERLWFRVEIDSGSDFSYVKQ